jgi:hypothetical protein
MDKLGIGSRNVEVYTKVSTTLHENLVYFTKDQNITGILKSHLILESTAFGA